MTYALVRTWRRCLATGAGVSLIVLVVAALQHRPQPWVPALSTVLALTFCLPIIRRVSENALPPPVGRGDRGGH